MRFPRPLLLALLALVLASCAGPQVVRTPPPAARPIATTTEYYRPPAERPAPVAPKPAPVTFFSGWKPSGPAPSIRASSYIVIDASTGRLLGSRNANTRRHVASTQKLLTALVVLAEEPLNGRVTVAASDTWVEPSKLSLKTGQTYTRRNLLLAMMVKSANDVANVVARDCAGSTEAFASKMNAYARRLGCRDSHFKNAHGLTVSGQYSTAADVSRIARAAWRSSFLRDAMKRKTYSFRYSTGTTITLTNTNKCLTRLSACNGMKTGYTSASGRCLVSSATWQGRSVIVVQLGTTSSSVWTDGIKLMKWGLGMP